jgi:chemotaxis protein methyltransferase CheR
MTNKQFERVRRLSSSLTGIELGDRHRELLARRCRGVKLDSPGGLEALLGAAEEGDPGAHERLIGVLTTSTTGFFRIPRHFDIAAEHALRAIHRRGKARLWSAAAATGEEPFSLAMAVIGVTQRDDPPVTILATDVNPISLASARCGEYGDRTLSSLHPTLRAQFFSTPVGSGRWRVSEPARRLVEFRQLGLHSDTWPIEGPFDVVFCRNLLMYLQTDHRNSIGKRLASLMAPDGVLFLDPAEHLGEADSLFHFCRDGVYVPRSTEPLAEHLTAAAVLQRETRAR